MDKVTKELLAQLADMMGENLTGVAAIALDRMPVDSALEEALLDIIREWVTDHGPEHISVLTDTLISIFSEPTDTLARLKFGSSARSLTLLTDLLQTAEAAEKAQAEKWVRQLAGALSQFGVLVGQAVVIAAKGA